jgi:hypothetical protein
VWRCWIVRKQLGGLFGATGVEIVRKKCRHLLDVPKARPACTGHALGSSSEDAFSKRTK